MHVFKIEIEYVVTQGSYEDAWKSALEYANHLDNEAGDKHIFVHPTEDEFGSTPGVWCEGCEGEVFPGIRWPTATNEDESHEWVERCDECQRFDSDEDAADWLVSTYGDKHATKGEAVPVGCSSPHPYVEIIA